MAPDCTRGGVPAVAIMTTPERVCRERNARESGRLSEERMDRMFAALEPVQANEGFSAIHRTEWNEGSIGIDEILSDLERLGSREAG
jgi:hypothetical protein